MGRAAPKSPRCHAAGCPLRATFERPYCAPHLAMVPPKLLRLIRAELGRGGKGRGRLHQLLAAAADAIAKAEAAAEQPADVPVTVPREES